MEISYFKLGERQGGKGNSGIGGRGGYSEGIVTLKKDDVLHIVVGEVGYSWTTAPSIARQGKSAYNGGGCPYAGINTLTGGGGGATDFRIPTDVTTMASLQSRILVAGGGGGAYGSAPGGFGGGLNGGSRDAGGGSQTAGGTIGKQFQQDYGSNAGGQASFGVGAPAGGISAGGGGGWYGGGTGWGAGGGSGFVWTSETKGNVPSGYTVNEKYYLKSAFTKAGNASFTNTTGTGTETGHSGAGFAKITPIL